MPHVGTITGSMYLDTNPYLTGLSQASTATQNFQSRIDGIQFAGFNRGIFATTSLLYGLNRIISSMSRGMEDYSNVLGRIGTVADLTAASVQALADSMKDVSTAYGVSRKDIMGGMYTAAQSRFTSPAEMRAMSEGGALLSLASGREINVKKATDLMSVTRQALGIGMDAVKSRRLSDILLRGRDVGRWELDQMAAALGIPITVFGNQYANTLGGEETLRQLLAIMSTATLAGMSPTRAATGTRRMVERSVQLNKAGSLGDPLRRALRSVGYVSDDPISQALDEGGIEYLNTLLKLTGGSTTELNRLGFGSRDLMLLTSTMRGQGKQLARSYADLAYDAIEGTSDRYGTAMKGTYQYARDQLRSQWEITSQEFMKASIPLISEFTNMLSGLNRVAQSLPDGVKSFTMLVSALTSFRLALNFLGVRGPILRSLLMPGAGGVPGAVAGGAGGGMAGMAAMAAMGGMGGKGGKSVLAGGFPVGVKDITDYRKYINALVGGVSFKSVGELEKQALGIQTKGNYFRLRDERGRFTKLTSTDPNMPFIYENARRQKHGLAPIFRPPPTKSFLDSTGVKFKTLEELEKQALGIEKKGHYFRLRDESGKFTKVTSRDPNMPFIYENARRQKYGLAPIFRQPKSPFGSGFISGVAPMTGLYGGMALGDRMAGEDGGMLLPMLMGMGGMSVGTKLAGAYASGGMAGALGGLKAGAIGAGKMAPAVLTALVMYKLMRGSYKAASGYEPLSADEELAMLMKGKSKYMPLRFLGEIGSSLEELPEMVRYLYHAGMGTDKGLTALNISRGMSQRFNVRNRVLTGAEIFTDYSMKRLRPSMRMLLEEKGLNTPEALFKDQGFRQFFKEQTEQDFGRFLNRNQRITDPTAWGDQLSDQMKAYSTYLMEQEQREKREAALARVQDHTGHMRDVFAYLGGYNTMFSLENMQRKPFQEPYSDAWKSAYRAGGQKLIDKYMMGGEDKDYWEKMYGLDAELDIKGKAQSPFAQVEGLHRKLGMMRFFAEHGADLSDRDKVSDEMIIKGLGVDMENMSPRIAERVLAQVRGLDPGQWAQLHTPPASPFSRAMYYGSQEAYNATLERKDDPFQIELITGKLDQLVTEFKATEKETESRTEDFQQHLIDVINGSATSITQAIGMLGGEGWHGIESD